MNPPQIALIEARARRLNASYALHRAKQEHRPSKHLLANLERETRAVLALEVQI